MQPARIGRAVQRMDVSARQDAASTFGELVVRLRRRLGMTQRTLAARTQLHPSQLSRMEKGKENPPGVEKVLLLVDALHLTAEDATEFVEAAGYSTQVLHAGTGLGFPAPSISEPYAALHGALGRLRPEQQRLCVDAFVTLIEAFSSDERNRSRESGAC